MRDLLILISILFIVSCNTTGTTKKDSNTEVETTKVGEVFLLDTIVNNVDNIIGVKKLGTVNSGEILTGSFHIKNVTSESLVLVNINGYCGCLQLDYDKKPILSGETRKIGYTFDTKQKHGFQYSTIKIRTNKIRYKVQLEVDIKN
ncbi:MAG: DUF1573 domain-containing protein [Rikenellaceae bacterium]